MHAVGGQQDQYDEVGNQQRDVERIRVVEALESPVEEVLAEIRTNPLGGKDSEKRREARYEKTSQ
jgi:hypothetical protein